MAEKNMLEAIRDTLHEEMANDDRVVVMGEDVGVKGGVFGVTQGLHEEFGEKRVIDTPLAELSIVGIAIGMAVNGLRPIAEMQFADFSHPAFDQIVNEASRFRYRSAGAFNCPMIIRMPYGGGIHGGQYHSQSVEAYYAHVPGLKVVLPSTPTDAAGLLRSAIQDEDPVIFLEHKKLYRAGRQEVPDNGFTLPIGKADVKRKGTDLTVISYGLTLRHALEAAEAVADEGIDVEIVDVRTALPLDEDTIIDSVKKTSKVLIAHEDNKTMGLGAELAALIAEEALMWLDAPIHRFAGPDIPAMPYAKAMEDFYMPSPEKIADAIRDLAAY